jgi:hypothetical protein
MSSLQGYPIPNTAHKARHPNQAAHQAFIRSMKKQRRAFKDPRLLVLTGFKVYCTSTVTFRSVASPANHFWTQRLPMMGASPWVWKLAGKSAPIENSRFACGNELEISPPDTQEYSGSGRQAFVAMVQAAHLRDRDDLALARTLLRSRFRGIFVQARMSPTSKIIGEIGYEQTIQVSLVEHDDVIQTFPAERTNQPLE